MPLTAQLNYGITDRADPSIVADEGSLVLQACDLALSWGAQPATAVCTYSANLTSGQDIRLALAPVPVNSYVELNLGPYTFYGRCEKDTAEQGSGGRRRRLEFRDLRDYLAWDQVFAVFNQLDTRLAETASGWRRLRRYRHKYPADWGTNHWTYTTSPLSPTAILNALFAAGTVGSPWTWSGPAVMNTPLPCEFNWENGAELGAALLAVAEKLGLQFTLAGKYFLKFRRKGTLEAGETFPVDGSGNYVFPAGAENTEQGESSSGFPTRVFVVGERNLYQVINLMLEPDWAPGWTQFWDELFFFRKIFLDHTPAVVGDVEDQQRWANAEAKARTLTVRDVVGLMGGTFLDERLFGGRSRMDLPALGYIRELVLRAWRVPATILGRPAGDFELVNTGLAAVSHNASGVMSLVYDATLGTVESESGPGQVIANGVGIHEQAFRQLNPRNFDLAHWVTANSAWGQVGFQADPNGGDGRGFIVCEQPLYATTSLLVNAPETPQAAVMNANFTPTVPTVKAALTFMGETYVRPVTNGWAFSRDATLQESGLRLERVYNVSGGSPLENVPYLDGTTADAKADAAAGPMLLRQAVVVTGGYERLIPDGASALVLNGMYDRLRVWVSPKQGLRERIDFTTERAWSTFVPERHYDRNVSATRIFPGMEDLRAKAVAAQTYAQVLASDPALRNSVARAYRGQPGVAQPHGEVEVAGADGSTPKLKAGTPLWSESVPTGTPPKRQAVLPPATTSDHRTFRGVVARHEEDARGRVPVIQTPPCWARVNGGAGGLAKGDAVGLSAGHDYLAAATDAQTTVGLVSEAVAASATVLVLITPAGGGGSLPFLD